MTTSSQAYRRSTYGLSVLDEPRYPMYTRLHTAGPPSARMSEMYSWDTVY